MSDAENAGIKVTDRRMFTETGELREEFESVEASAPPEPTPPVSEPKESEPASEPQPKPATEAPTPQNIEPPSEPQAATAAETGTADTPVSEPAEGATASGSGPDVPPGYSAGARQPQFLDLVAMLAEPAALFLGDASMPGQEPMEDLERARMHIDLLGLLESKCAGNLTEQESLVLSDLVYRLRMRYVEKKG